MVRKWSDCSNFYCYTLTLDNRDDVTSDQGCSAVPEFTVLHTRDSYFTVVVRRYSSAVKLGIGF